MVTEALHHNSEVLHHYDLHAHVVMPNPLLTPLVPLPALTKSIKKITARRANTLGGMDGI